MSRPLIKLRTVNSIDDYETYDIDSTSCTICLKEDNKAASNVLLPGKTKFVNFFQSLNF